jgi:(S)-ureidoglycine aminohydrolase
MKIVIAGIFLLFLGNQFLIAQPLLSKVNSWEIPALDTRYGSRRTMFSGSGEILARHQLIGHCLSAGKKLIYDGTVKDELFFIVKYGPVHFELNEVSYELDKGSVVFLLPGDRLVVENRRKDEVEVYEMRMAAFNGPDKKRGVIAGPSFVINWYDMEYKPHDRGGVRQLFDRKTAMLNRFDIHITSLNPGISSHAPHTHKNEEIILMIDGIGEMQLGDEKQKITTGDAAWVGSDVPHNFTNTGKRPAVYFAIQWN